jgi:hypothetical protein
MNGDEEFYEGQEDVFTKLAQTDEVIITDDRNFLSIFRGHHGQLKIIKCFKVDK